MDFDQHRLDFPISSFGAVVAERVGLALRFENEGSEPGREAVWQIENGQRFKAKVSSLQRSRTSGTHLRCSLPASR